MKFASLLDHAFEPKSFWGAEFLQNRVRICGIRAKDLATVKTFEGTYAEAEVFADSNGLQYAGLFAAISHLPYKWENLGNNDDEDISPQIERLRPIGLNAESLQAHEIHSAGHRHLWLIREEALNDFVIQLPKSLSELWCLIPSPWPIVFAEKMSGDLPQLWAGLYPEEQDTQVIFFRESIPVMQVKVFAGLDRARMEPSAYAKEIGKALIYHFGVKFPGAAIESYALWKDGGKNEAANALAVLPISLWQNEGAKAAETGVPSAFHVAQSMARMGARDAEVIGHFTLTQPALAQQHRQWMQRTQLLAKMGTRILLIMFVVSAMAAGLAGSLAWLVQSKEQESSGELQRWERYQSQKFKVEAKLQSLDELLQRRSLAFSSLQSIGKTLPPEVWLSDWEVERISIASGDSKYLHRLTGYSLEEERIPQFLANLESLGLFTSVKLRSTERIKPEKVEKETGIAANRRGLIQFQMIVTE